MMRRAIGHLLTDISHLLRSLWGLALVALFAELGYAVMQMAALPLYLRSAFRMSDGRPLEAWIIGLIISTFLITETAFKVPFGVLSDRYGRKPFIVGGTLIAGLTPFVMRVVHSPYAFLPLRALDGVGAAALWPTVFASVAALSTDDRRVAAMSIFNMTYLIGVALGLPVYSLVYANVRHHSDVFLVVSAAFLTATVLGIALVPAVPRGKADDPDGVAEKPLSLKEAIRLAQTNRTILVMMVLSLIYTLGTTLLSGMLSLYAKDVIGLSEDRIGLIFLGPGLVVVLLSIPLGWLGGRWGRVKSVRFGMAVAAAAMWLIPHTRSLASLTAIAVPLVIGFLMALPAWMAMVTEAAPPGQQGVVVAAVTTAQGIGAMVAPAIGGRLYDWHPTWPFYASAMLLTLALAIAFTYFHEPNKGLR
jgi:DHA1 family multidrug resistance protein-like MFS transporter